MVNGAWMTWWPNKSYVFDVEKHQRRGVLEWWQRKERFFVLWRLPGGQNMRAEGRSSMVECGTTVIKRNRFWRASLIGSVLSSIDHQHPTQEGVTPRAKKNVCLVNMCTFFSCKDHLVIFERLYEKVARKQNDRLHDMNILENNPPLRMAHTSRQFRSCIWVRTHILFLAKLSRN